MKSSLASNGNKTKKSKKPKYNLTKRFDRIKKHKTTPVDDSSLSIREMKSTDKLDVAHIINSYKHEFYINIYKMAFRSWFAYFTVACLLGLSLSTISSSLPSLCLPPFLITIFLIWKVNR